MENIKEIFGDYQAKGLRLGLIVSRFNEFIAKKLLEGAIDGLLRHGAAAQDITVVWVPGAFEMPLTADNMAASGKYDAIICVGAIIRGATSHFDFVAAEAAKGIAMASLKNKLPIVFGVLTTENIEQAIERAGAKAGNKGFDAANTAIEMANLLRKLK